MEHYKEGASTFIELLRWRAENQSGKLAYQFLDNGETEGASYTYGELDKRAKSVAAHLQKLIKKGDRVILVFDNDLEYIAVFYACLYAGIISAPLHPPGRNKSMFRISSVTKDSDAKLILTTAKLRDELREQFSADPVLKDLGWIATDEMTNEHAGEWRDPGIVNNDIAFLQYTSGSTGSPKGVMVTHDNLLYNIYSTIYRYGLSELDPKRNDSLVTWAPLFHDLGLIFCTLLPLYGGFPCYMMTPEAFIQRPVRWLETITKYGSTISGAPNFAYELLTNRVSKEEVKTLDLSSWDIAMNGSEPVRAETLEKFAEHFAPAGFKPHYFSSAWGQAETTIIITTTHKDSAPVIKSFDKEKLEKHKVSEIKADDKKSLRLVGHTMNLLDAKVIIVDPKKLTKCREDEVGEIWVSGSTVTPGYFNKPKANKETFQAFTKDTKEGPFLRTGDLGFIQGDQLFITGRYKDLIIIRGQNHYPQDIELTVERSHPALRLGCEAAFSVEADGEEQLIVVQEINKKFADNFDPDEVCKAIRKAVSEEHNLNVYHILLLKTGTVRKTSSGKIQRNDNKQSYLDGTLSVIAEWRQGMGKAEFTKSESNNAASKTTSNIKSEIKLSLKEWLVNKASELMKVQPGMLDTSESFASYGMDSLRAVQFSGEISTYLKKQLPATLVYNYPSVNLLLKYLENDSIPERSSANEMFSEKKNQDLNEPIAVIGMACRFPGSENTELFWKLLSEGKDAIKEFPDDERWDIKYLNDRSTITHGGYLKGIDQFDPQFFGISPREAIQMDPQQRLLLEVSWEALEDAAIDPSSLKGKNAGVFMGVCSYDYARFSVGEKDLFDVYTGTGTSLSIVANRLSYLLDLRGPSVAIDTACSSSLVAIHQACNSLRSGESSIAITGGVSLILSPDTNTIFTKTGFLSADGKCKTFDKDANGYVRGEGCGVLILKPLSEAVKDSDRILALIKGSAVNQDGKSNGLTAPNGLSQEDVIRKALNNASAEPSDITYIESHGTGTPLGDPIEVNSIKEVIAKGRAADNICYIGSVKTNIGHLEGAAGIAGVIKTVLSLQHKEIPKHLNFNNLNEEILINGTPVKVAVEKTDWKENPVGKRLAGISSFGFGGTNAHIILEEAPEISRSTSAKSKPYNLMTLSAKSEKALHDYAERYESFISMKEDLNRDEICYTSNTGRADFSSRMAVVASDRNDLVLKLKEFLAGEENPDIITGETGINQKPKIAFLFPGQGAQYIGMGKELYDTLPLFRKIINLCDEILRSYLEKPLLEVLFYEKDEKLNPLNETSYTQPALFAVEYALAKVWMSWGINPDVMMGHSAGEYVAACLAGVFSLEDGLKLTAERGRLMQTMTENGEMYTIFESEKFVKDAIKGFEENVSIASINSPVKTVISGNKYSIAKILPYFDSNQIEYKKINVSIASHSPLMNTMIEAFRKVCSEVKYSKAEIPIVSNISGEIITDKILNADYWCDHIMSTVRFSESIKECVKSGCNIFIDLGSMPTSIGMAQETIQDAGIKWIASIKKNFTVWETMLQGLGTLYVNNAKVDWEGFDADFSHRKISLPKYPFQRQRYWIEDLKQKIISVIGDFITKEGSRLLGKKISLANSTSIIYNTNLSADNPSFIREHSIYGKPVFPTTAYIEFAMEAAKEILGTDNIKIEDLLLYKAFLFAGDSVYNMQIVLNEKENKIYEFEIYSSELDNEGNANEWVKHVTGKLFRSIDKGTAEKTDLSKLRSGYKDELDTGSFYVQTKADGIEYEKHFNLLSKIFVNGKSVFAYIKAGEEITDQFKDYNFHPVLLDACLHTSFVPLLGQMNPELIYLPIGISSVNIYGKAESDLTCHLEYNSLDIDKAILHADLRVYSGEGRMIALIKGIQMKKVSKQDFIEASQNYLKDWLYDVIWKKSEYAGAETDTPEFKTAELKDKLTAMFPELIEENQLALFRKSMDRVDALSTDYIADAFQKLGIDFTEGKKFRTDELELKLGVIKSHSKLLKRLLDILSEDKFIRKENNEWIILKTPKADAVPSRLEKLKVQGLEANAEMDLLKKCGSLLPEMLTGRKDPLQLLFPDGDFTSLLKLYERSPAFSAMNGIIKSVITESLKLIPQGKPVRILEIGAGTGATASIILEKLKGVNAEYVFTDVSQLFINKAKERFKEFDFAEFKLLDIEKDPSGQNFDLNNFDIIIASNVIHATRDIKQSLINIKKLLKKNGMLVLTEAIEKQKWVDLVFGLTEGWWRFEDNDLREDYALFNAAKWKQVLEESGFNEAEIILPEGKNNRSLTSQAVIIAKGISNAGANYLILSGKDNFGSKLREELASRGISGTLINSGEDDSENKISDILNNENIDSIIHLLSLDEYSDKMKDEDAEKLSSAGCESVLKLIRLVSDSMKQVSPKLIIVTKQSQPVVPDDKINGLNASSMWGLGKVINLEHPGLKCVRIDISGNDEQEIILTADEVLSDSNEGEVAFRNGIRYVSRLTHSVQSTGRKTEIKNDCAYLITGGTKGIGLLFAEYLADKGAGHLVLISRNEISSDNLKKIEAIRKSGTDVITVKADITDKEKLKKIIDDIKSSGHPLKGIIQSAGLLDDGIIGNQNKDKFDRVMAPKILGSWYLGELTEEMDLDFFIMFSSIASMLGSAGQSNHSAANAFLDSFAYYRRARGLTAAAINWGVWSEIGSAAAIGADRQEKIPGLNKITPEHGLKLFDRILNNDVSRIGAFSIDWKRFEEKVTSNQMLNYVSELLERDKSEVKNSEEATGGKKKISILDELRESSPDDHTELLTKYFRKLISGILGLKETELAPNMPLNTIGLDSLMAIELKNRVNIELGVDLNIVKYMEDTNIMKLAEELKGHLKDKLYSNGITGGINENKVKYEVTEEEKTRDLLENLDNLSEEELDKLLNEIK